MLRLNLVAPWHGWCRILKILLTRKMVSVWMVSNSSISYDGTECKWNYRSVSNFSRVVIGHASMSIMNSLKLLLNFFFIVAEDEVSFGFVLPIDDLSSMITSLLNVSREKNTTVRSSAESAIVSLLRLRHTNHHYQVWFKKLDCKVLSKAYISVWILESRILFNRYICSSPIINYSKSTK